MKKNISINISGIIFHIEEDGFERLKVYLESINKYFSTFDDSGEIVADIESRIAEIFLSKLNEGKQIITSEDVDFITTIMGSIRDLKVVEEEEPAKETKPLPETKSGEESKKEQYSETTTDQKKLHRDTNRKLLGGVASGIANYFSIDPL